MSAEEQSHQGGKIIDGSVGAQAGAAGVTVNQGVSYSVKEVIHHRYLYDPATGQEIKRDTMIENELTSGERPEGVFQFQGIGTLEANIRQAQGPPQVHREQYRFNVAGETIEEAWASFTDWEARGAVQATADFRRKYAEYEEKLRSQLLVPGSGSGLVGPGGTPLGR